MHHALVGWVSLFAASLSLELNVAPRFHLFSWWDIPPSCYLTLPLNSQGYFSKENLLLLWYLICKMETAIDIPWAYYEYKMITLWYKEFGIIKLFQQSKLHSFWCFVNYFCILKCHFVYQINSVLNGTLLVCFQGITFTWVLSSCI